MGKNRCVLACRYVSTSLVFLDTYIDTCMHTCTHAHMHTCTHAYMHTCMHIYIHLHMHTCAGTRAHVQAERQDSGAPETTSLSSDVEGGKRGDAGRGPRPGQGLGLGDAGCSTAHCLALAVLPSVFAFVQVSTTQSRRKMAKVRRPLFWLKGGTYLTRLHIRETARHGC